VNSFPEELVVADVNGDGISDLVIPLSDVSEVAVLLGNGNGTFQSPKFSPYDGSGNIVVGDFTGDHKADLATPERLYSGSGDGFFHFHSLLPKSGNFVLGGNFNKDGSRDLVVIGFTDLWTLLGNGHGDFTVKATPFVVPGAYGMGPFISTDLNGDGIADLVIQEQILDSPVVTGPPTMNVVAMGKADGTFSILPAFGDGLSTVSLQSIGLGDVNGDKKLDLVTTGSANTAVLPLQVHTYLGKGNGTFQPFVSASVNCYGGLAMGDLNGNGRSDLLCNSGSDQNGTLTITFFSSNGNGSYTQGSTFKILSSTDPSAAEGGVYIADLNGDDTRDAILLNPGFLSTNSSVTVLLNLSGTSMAVTTTPSTLAYKQPFSVVASVKASITQTPHPGGSVVYKNGSGALGSVAVGTALHVAAGLAVGTYSVSATYEGDGNFNPHTITATKTVGKATSSTKLISSANPSTHSHAVTLTATAAPQFTGVPGGKITFRNGATVLATVTMASGKATFTTSSLGVGTHSITATYTGDGNFDGSGSAVLSQKVN
jgi:hypothetical protein